VAFPRPNGAAVAVRNPSGLRIRKTYQERGARRRHVVDRMPAGSSNGWQFHAACRGEDSALFFAPSYFERREEKAAREARAKALCARCPVLEDCLEFALRVREPHGVWGGLNEQERRQLLRRRRMPVA
jgi:WhiB family redox-sensing transcriptional regulator